MLTSNYISILRFIRDHAAEDISFDAIADKFGRPDSVSRLHYLEENHFTYYAGSFCKFVKISPKGLAALEEYESVRQKEINDRAEQERKEKEQSAKDDVAVKKQQRHDLLVASIGAAVGSAVTGFIDHFAEICSFIEKLID